MSSGRHYLGVYALIVSVLWAIWVFQAVPAYAVSPLRQCHELQTAAGMHDQAFIDLCMQKMNEGSERVLVWCLLLTLLALVLLSVATLLRERSLFARIGRPRQPLTLE
jgi:hypothetical protein